jgi:hypothetical protein
MKYTLSLLIRYHLILLFRLLQVLQDADDVNYGIRVAKSKNHC